MTYTNSLQFAGDQTSDSIDSFNWPKGREGFCLTGSLHLPASCDRTAGSEEMGASLQAFHPLLCKLDTTKRFEDSLFFSYEPTVTAPQSTTVWVSPFIFRQKTFLYLHLNVYSKSGTSHSTSRKKHQNMQKTLR